MTINKQKIEEKIISENGRLVLYKFTGPLDFDDTSEESRLRINIALFDNDGNNIPLKFHKEILARWVYGPGSNDVFSGIYKKNKTHARAITFCGHIFSISYKTGTMRIIGWTK